MVIIPVSGIEVNPTTADLIVGESVQLTATVQPVNASNQEVNWSSSDTEIVSVSSSGEVLALAQGTASITVSTAGNEFSASTQINVSIESGLDAQDFKTTGLNVFPNPALEKVRFSTTHNFAKIELFDITGQRAQMLAPENLSEIEIDLTSLKQGYYIVKATDCKQNTFLESLIIE